MKDATEEDEKIEEGKMASEVAPLTAIDIRVEQIEPPLGVVGEVLQGDDTGAASPVGNSSESTEVGSSNGSNKKGKTVDRKTAADNEAQKTKGQGLAGKINVLMAADVEAVIEGER